VTPGLDAQVAQLLAWVARAGGPSYPELGAAAARAHYERVATTLDIAPAGLASVEELQVALPGRTLRVRHYVPREHGWAEPMPALLFFHGGGFTIGSVDTHDRVCRMLAARADCVVLSVDYRLAPEDRFPAAADDAFEVLDWVSPDVRRAPRTATSATASCSTTTWSPGSSPTTSATTPIGTTGASRRSRIPTCAAWRRPGWRSLASTRCATTIVPMQRSSARQACR
jgi:acetyl esterase